MRLLRWWLPLAFWLIVIPLMHGVLPWAISTLLILEEIAKCDLVCANCHRIRTWKSGRETPWNTKHRKYNRSQW